MNNQLQTTPWGMRFLGQVFVIGGGRASEQHRAAVFAKS